MPLAARCTPPGARAEAEPERREPSDLWEELRAKPEKFWDNREGKRNPRAPDYKHKDTGAALWLNSRERPSWISIDGHISG